MNEIITAVLNSDASIWIKIFCLTGVILFTYIGWNIKVILRRIRLAEFKHVATIDALQKNFKNGFYSNYENKLNQLLKEYNFKIKGVL